MMYFTEQCSKGMQIALEALTHPKQSNPKDYMIVVPVLSVAVTQAAKIKGNFFFHVGNKHATITYWLHAGEIGWRSRWHPVEICCMFNTNMKTKVSLDFRGLCYCNGE